MNLMVILLKKTFNILRSLAENLRPKKEISERTFSTVAIKDKKTVSKVLKEKKRWYVPYGFNKNEESETGYLSFRQKPSFKYEVVDDIKLAKRFPADNYDKLDDFAPPEKWMKFFNQEHELSDWKFHLVATTGLQFEMKKNEQL